MPPSRLDLGGGENSSEEARGENNGEEGRERNGEEVRESDIEEVNTRRIGNPTFSYKWEDAMNRLKSLELKLSTTQRYTPQGNTFTHK